MPRIHPFLWFHDQALPAARFYVSVFPNSRILSDVPNAEAAPGPTGQVMVVDFEIDGQRVTALNGGPVYTLSPAFSFVIDCEDQAEVDYYWDKLVDGGQPSRCGWLTDRFGLSWQIVPVQLVRLLGGPDPARAQRAFAAMMEMKRIDIAAIERAAAG